MRSKPLREYEDREGGMADNQGRAKIFKCSRQEFEGS